MKSDKVRNLTEEELRHQESDLADQLFKLKFQLKMGQTESLKKIRGLRKDVARIKTIVRQKELGIMVPLAGDGRSSNVIEAAPSPAKKAVKKPKIAVAKKKATA